MVALQRPNGMNFYCFANGKLVEEYGQTDLLTLPQQIGTVPKEIALSRARRHRNRGRGIHSLPESPPIRKQPRCESRFNVCDLCRWCDRHFTEFPPRSQ